ncbi:MAG: hypothetical protein HYZ00_10675, partial [Candidatus Hydrogenedentes bacterium]|nr:hypothetical protein [Candidatus Hydrogenedentota bacterium]
GMGLVAVFIGDVAERYALDLNGLRHKVDRGVAVLLAVIHGVVAPLSLPFSSLSVVLPGRILEINLHRLNLGSDLRQKSVLFINAPYDVFGASLLTMLSAEAMAAPRHLWALTAGTGPVTVKRTAVDGLEVTCEEGCFSYPFGVTFYDVSEPLRVGDSVETADFTVTVTALTVKGWPETLRFVFKQDLESPDFDWYCTQELRLAPFPVPAVGESTFLPGTDALALLRLLLKEAVP